MSLRWTGLIDIKKGKLFFYNECMMLIESPMSLHTKLVGDDANDDNDEHDEHDGIDGDGGDDGNDDNGNNDIDDDGHIGHS